VHPILGRIDRLAAYLAVWLSAGVLLAGLYTRFGLGWIEALALLSPLFLVYAFVCLSAWYVSRATPLTTSSILRVLLSSAAASTFASALWLALAQGWIAALSMTAAFAPAADRYAQQLPFMFAFGILLFLLSLAVHYVLLAFESALRAKRRQLELEIVTRDAELRALRAQIDPHFLYNSLNSISALTGSDAAGARRMCLLLGEFLRNTLDVSARQRIPLAEELALAERYLKIEQVRFGSRLRVEQRVDEDAAGCLVPPLMLQPLVENAVTHGIAKLLEGGLIRLDISRANNTLAIVIENPLDEDSGGATARPGGMGLDNVRNRLDAMFGRDARMDIHARDRLFRVELHIPADVEPGPRQANVVGGDARPANPVGADPRVRPIEEP
jgi:two-component system sensor histidine kinase AlgZ